MASKGRANSSCIQLNQPQQKGACYPDVLEALDGSPWHVLEGLNLIHTEFSLLSEDVSFPGFALWDS